jgi:hypothetical protein
MIAIAKIFLRFLILLVLVLGIAGCGLFKISNNEQLSAVSQLSNPKLPDWIEQISPTGVADPLAQILIRFKEPLIPVESLDSPNQQQLLQRFQIVPPLPGQFRFLTPRMVGFQADKALPKATRVRVTLKSGLADLKNHRLYSDLAWTFNTEPIKLTNLPATNQEYYSSQAIELKPKLKFTSNVELDLNSVREHLQLMPQGKDQPKAVPVKVSLIKEEKSESGERPQEQFDPSVRNWEYAIAPRQSLEKATNYRLEFSPGLRPSRGNLPTETAFSSQVSTYSPLAFKNIEFYGQPSAGGAYGRFVKGSPQLVFNNPVLADSAVENITVSPAPKNKVKLLQADGEINNVGLNPYALEPATNYTITIGANLKDKFGQTLGQPINLQYQTGDVSGDLWVPSDLNIFPVGKDIQLNISTVNLPESKYKATYKVVEPTDLVYTDSAGGENYLPDAADWQSFPVSAKKNQYKDLTVPIRQKIGAATGMLAYGVQARTNTYQENGKQQWREPTFYGMVQLTNLGVFSQWFPKSGLIRVHHLSDGSPANAAVEVYESKLGAKSRTQSVPCASGKTDASGMLILRDRDLQSCFNSNTAFTEEGPKLLVIARENRDWAFSRTDAYSGAYGYGIDTGWDNGKPLSRGTIFSDRQLYQPGEKAAFTGMAYYLQNGTLKQDKNTSYKVKLLNPDGKETDLGTKNTNQFGTFSLELPFKTNQPLGYYTIQAKSENGNEISGEFRVAEFKPPNFKVDLALDREFAVIDDTIAAKATSNYLFGSPVEGGKATYYVTRQPTRFIPKGWDKFEFGRQWFYPEESPNVPSDVLQSQQVLDATGNSSQTFKVAKDLPYPMTYRVDVQVKDVSNLAVSNSKTFVALPSDRFIGLQSNFVADAGKPFPIQVIVSDRTGKVLEGQRVRVELQAMKYSSVTQLVEGGSTANYQVEYKNVGQVEVTSGSSPQTVSLTPSESGSYRIRANFVDARDELTATDTQIWATGNNAVDWLSDPEDRQRLEIRLDKESYKPGETATALLQSPYPEGELYFAVIRNNTIFKQVTKVKGGAPQIQFQVTPEMLPNAAVEAVLVRQGKPLSQVDTSGLQNLVKIGFAPFKVNLEDKYLKVQVKPNAESVQPGTEQTVQLELQNAQGSPVQGQVTVMVVNEAVLQLSGYRPPDLVDTVYAEQLISTRFSDNRPNVVLKPQSSPLPKGWGYGGGYSSAAANTRIRKNFQPLAYYNGSVLTDDGGKASVKFTLPDDLTTWRVMVVATDGNLRFGNAETTFISTKSLITNPILPQFVRPGDRLQAGLSVTNNTGGGGNLNINGAVTGSLKLDNNPGNLQTQSGSGTQAYRFPMVAGSAGNANLRFTTELNGTTDAFELPLEVKPYEITEQVVESGVSNNSVKIPLNVDNSVIPDTGGLEVSLASTLIPEIKAPAREALDEEQLPFSEPAASQLAIASNLQTLSQKYEQSFAEFNPKKQATKSLQTLQKLQKPDGGFASYPGANQSDPWVSAYTAAPLNQARQAFPDLVDDDIVGNLRAYLKKVLLNPGQYNYCKDAQCKNELRLQALIGLDELGEKRNDFLSDIYQQRDRFDVVSQIKLARYLSQFPEWQKESQQLAKQFQENVYETGRTAKVNIREASWISSPATAQSQALRLFVAQKAKPEVIDRLLKGLLALRRDGTWQDTYDNAEALTALVEYSELQPTPPNFVAKVQLAGKKLGEAKFEGNKSPSLDIKTAIAQLPRGRNDLILQKSGKGTLHYLVSYRYRLPGNQPGRFNGLRVIREIRRVNQEKPLSKFGLSTSNEALNLEPGQVFDIGLEIIADRPIDNLIITDPLPAGLEAVDASLQATGVPPTQERQDDFWLKVKNIYRDRIVAYGDRLEPGIYNLHYLVRSVTPGTFYWPGAEAHLQYAPEEFGRSADSTLTVSGNS